MKIDPQLKEDLKKYVQQKLSEHSNVVTISAAYQLGEMELTLLKKNLPFLQEAEIHQEIDPTVLAGVIIKFGSKMIDLSLQSELQKLQQIIYESA